MTFVPVQPTSPVTAPGRGSGPLWSTLWAAAIFTLVVIYVALAGAQVYILSQIANDLNTGAGASEAQIQTWTTLSHAYAPSFWAMYIAFFVWNAILRSRLRAVGTQHRLRAMTAWKVWRVGVIASVVLLLVTNNYGSVDTPEAAHKLMLYYAFRMVIGLVYLWVVYSVWRATATAFDAASQKAMTPGYGAPAIQQPGAYGQPYAPTQYGPPQQPYPPTQPYAPPFPPYAQPGQAPTDSYMPAVQPYMPPPGGQAADGSGTWGPPTA